MSSDQPKPATGEWTEETVLKFYGDEFPTSAEVAIAIEIANAHNAALAASVHYWQGVATQEWHKGFAASHDEHQKQLAAEREKVAASQDLMAEVRQWHSDKDSPDYNECDTAPCQWCESSLKLGTECMDAHVRQKTWELQQQLAAEVAKREGIENRLGVAFDRMVHDYQQQLAAEKEVVFNLDKQVQEITEALITTRQQQQTLVDALERLLNEGLKVKAIIQAKDALAR